MSPAANEGLTVAEQVELANQRERDLLASMVEIVNALGASNWDPVDGVEQASMIPCEQGADHFYFQHRTRNAEPFIMSEAHDRAEVLAAADATFREYGMRPEAAETDQRTTITAIGTDLHAFLSLNVNGNGRFVLRTSCSDEWPGFELTSTEYLREDR